MGRTTLVAAVAAGILSLFGVHHIIDGYNNGSKRNVDHMCMAASTRALYAWDVMVEMRSEGENIFNDFSIAEFYTYQPLNDAFRRSLSSARTEYEAAGMMLSNCLRIYHEVCGVECLPNPRLSTGL